MIKAKQISIFLCVFGMIFCLSSCKSKEYDQAVQFQESGEYDAALEIFENISNYKDSAERIDTCKSMIAAIENFNVAQGETEKRNYELDAAISAAESLVSTKPPALDETLLPKLESAISNAKAEKRDIPEMPNDADSINELVNELNSIDYSSVLSDIADTQTALEASAEQYELVNAPTEVYVIKCLRNVPHVIDISAVTEGNDPNGKLNKAGGYTAQIYFSSDLINQESILGTTVIEKGTDCGGSIEVYTNPEDANKRNEYLAAFDGSLFASGSHTVIGTVLIRTSNELTASDQKQLEDNIVMALTQTES